MAKNREGWLTACAESLVKPLEVLTGKDMPNFRISVGFPSRNAISVSKRRIGECWHRVVCKDDMSQIFISPLLGSPMEVAATVAHELVHAIVGTEHGHRRPFAQVARGIGLTGRMTATVPGEAFIAMADPMLAKLGPYPHSGMAINGKYRAAPTRMLKAACPECDYKVRITRVWLDAEGYGAPLCPAHNVQMIEA